MTRLEQERRRRGWNQTALAYRARITQGEVSRFERRMAIPSPNYATRIGRALGLAPINLLDEVQGENNAGTACA